MPRQRALKPPICYLCGDTIEGASNRDHVPPRHYFATRLRRQFNLDRLITLRTHVACNSAYREDEEYFSAAVAPLAIHTPTGLALVEDMFDRAANGSMTKLVNHSIAEFEENPPEIVVPEGKIAKRIRRSRVERIIWKIVRGLFFHRHGEVLPESTPHAARLLSPDEPVPDVYKYVVATEPLGPYATAFDYKNQLYQFATKAHDVWALLFWDGIIAFCAFPVDVEALPEIVPLAEAPDPGPRPDGPDDDEDLVW